MRRTEQGSEARCRICAEQFRPAQTRWQTALNVCEAIRQFVATGRYPHIDEPRACYVPAPETRGSVG